VSRPKIAIEIICDPSKIAARAALRIVGRANARNGEINIAKCQRIKRIIVVQNSYEYQLHGLSFYSIDPLRDSEPA